MLLNAINVLLTIEILPFDLEVNVSPLAQSMPNKAQMSPAYASSTSYQKQQSVVI